MNMITLEALKMLLEMQNNDHLSAEQKKQALGMVDKLLMIMEKDVKHAFQSYATVKV